MHVPIIPQRLEFIKQNHVYARLYKSDKKSVYAYFCICAHTLLLLELISILNIGDLHLDITDHVQFGAKETSKTTEHKI